MIRSQTLTISDREIEELFEVMTNYDHETVKRGGFGETSVLSASVANYYRNGNYNDKINTSDVVKQLIELLKEKGHVSVDAKCSHHVKATHHWSAFDDDGYASSIYHHQIEIIIKTEYVELLKTS